MRIANGAARIRCSSMAAATTNAAIVRTALKAPATHVARSGAVFRPAGDTGRREANMGDAVMASVLCDAAIFVAIRWLGRRFPHLSREW
jgi:hypothetical protein